MFNSKTTLVVGAGASAELGMPVGSELKQTIATKLDIRFSDGYKQSSGDRDLTEAYGVRVRSEGQRDINPYRAAGVSLSEALPLAISIDNLLEAHAADAKKVFCGKLGIVKCVLDAERDTALHVRHNDAVDFSNVTLQTCWLTSLHRCITEGVSASQIGHSLSNLSFLIFNYDRCVETFLYHSLQRYYKMSADSAGEILNSVQFVHPYGAVGLLPWQSGSDPRIDFGAEASSQQLVDLSGSIKIFTEQLSEGFDETVVELTNSEAILFLGFAYHPQNLELVGRAGMSNCRRILGTVLGFSEPDSIVIRQQLAKAVRFAGGPQDIELSPTSCAKLFLNYSKSITQ